MGAGPAGAGVALALCRAGVPGVLLIDRPADPRPAVGESAAPQVGALLRELGLPQALDTLGHAPYHGNLSVWGDSAPVAADFLLRGAGHGWHLDRAAFDSWLRSAAVAAGAELLAPAAVDAISRSEAGGWRIAVRPAGDGRDRAATSGAFAARVVVDASGRRAAVAARLGVRRHRLDRQIALVGHATPAYPERLHGRAFIEAVADGWWYAARLPDGRAVVMLMTDADIGRDLDLKEPDRFRRAWAATRHLRELVPPVAQSRVHVFSCATQYLEQVVGPGWIAVGDAMIGFDPLTASGIAGALGDALAAAGVILRWFAGDGAAARGAAADYARRADITLRRYLAERRDHYRAGSRWPDRQFWQRRTD